MSKEFKFVLASASPARKKVLEDAGLEFEVVVSEVDEEGLLAQKAAKQKAKLTVHEQVQILAEAKALATAKKIIEQITEQNLYASQYSKVLVLGCDSLFEIDGQAQGKPHSPAVAIERIQKLSSKTGKLYTGHAIIEVNTKNPTAIRQTGQVVCSQVWFEEMDLLEIEAYVENGEPLEVAGSFAIDGLGSAFINRIEGDYYSIVGVSPNALRNLLKELNYSITNFWRQ